MDFVVEQLLDPRYGTTVLGEHTGCGPSDKKVPVRRLFGAPNSMVPMSITVYFIFGRCSGAACHLSYSVLLRRIVLGLVPF